jgi:hypothetical protein
MLVMRATAAITVFAMTAIAHGEPVAIDPRPRPPAEPVEPRPEEPLTSDEVRGAPVPGDEHGRLDPLDPGDSTTRKVARTLLWIPRLPIELFAQPVRGLLYLQDRYSLADTVSSPFPATGRAISISPTAQFETGFGFNIGARARFTDVFGGEQISAGIALGGQVSWAATVGVYFGNPWVVAGIDARWERADEEHFFGYGNGDVVTPAMPIDPLASDAAAPSEFETETAQASPRVKLHLPWKLALTATGAVVRKTFAAGEGGNGTRPIDEAFAIGRLPRFSTGTTFLYDELELAWDTRRRAHPWDSPAMRGTGGLALAFAARQQGLRDGESGFYRLGFDLQRYLRLGLGPRVLELRAHGELVTGSRDEVPFSELPRLGGSRLLRGYDPDRFRDRVAVVTQASYLWAASRWFAPSLFVDVGRVYSGLDELSLDGKRVGYGAALEAYGQRNLFLRMQIASSIDGGVFVYLMFDAMSDVRTRQGRY